MERIARRCWRLEASSARGSAIGARTDGAEMIVRVDAGGMTVGERDLDGVVPYRGGGLGFCLGLEHGERRELRAGRRGQFVLLVALFVAGGARAVFADVGEVVVARVAVCPGDVDASVGGDVDFDGGRVAEIVERNGHEIATR